MAARIHFSSGSRNSTESDASAEHIARQVFDAASVRGLPSDDAKLIELLLLFPIAALIIVVCRNVIGLTTFGTFTPALLGLAFRDLSAWPGMLAFIGIVFLGWFLRRLLDRFHLLQVPRVSIMLCAVVSLLAAFVIASHRLGFVTTRHVSLFPLVILTGMIERLWTMEEEDGVRASLRTLMATLSVSFFVGLLIGRAAVGRFVVTFPESVGLTMAALRCFWADMPAIVSPSFIDFAN